MSKENPMNNNKEEELLRRAAELEETIRRETEALNNSNEADTGNTNDNENPATTSALETPANSKELGPLTPSAPSSATIPPTSKPENIGRTEKETTKEASDFISQFKLESLLPSEFKDLDEAQRLKVIRDLKRRIVDIVKSDSQTQYSEFTKKKTAEMVKPDANIIKRGAFTALDAVMQSLSKESNLKKIEGKVFNELMLGEDGRKLIAEDLKRLTEITKDRVVGISEEGNPAILYINSVNTRDMLNITQEEEKAFDIFNQRAFIFTKMPYEWGQEEGGKHRRQFDEAAEKYEESRNEVLKIKESREAIKIQNGEIGPEAKGAAMLEMLEMDSSVQMEQLLNTHPEFEEMLAGFEEDAGGKEVVKTAGNFLQTITGGKNWENKVITAGGFTARMLVKGAAVLTGATAGTALSAPLIGGAVGYWRGKVRAQKTLEEREKGARHGQEDESKEAINTVSAENLNKRLETIIRAFEVAPVAMDANTPEETWILNRADRLDQIARRIKYTQDKIENGLVNFGDAKTALANQYNLINNLNRATIIAASLEETTHKEIDARLKQFLEYKGEKIDAAQNEFIKKQARRGMLMGAGFAAAGYAVRWFGEQMHWWGNPPTRINLPNLKHPGAPELPPDYNSISQTPPPNIITHIEPVGSPIASAFPVSVTFEHGKGGIQGILDLKDQIRQMYPDISKAPHSVQDFMHTDATKEAVRLGLFAPNATDGKESALIGEGSVLKLDPYGNVTLHDTLTGKDNVLIHGDNAEIEHYSGKMFHSGHQNVHGNIETEEKINTLGEKPDPLRESDEFGQLKHPAEPIHTPETPTPEEIRKNLLETYEQPKAPETKTSFGENYHYDSNPQNIHIEDLQHMRGPAVDDYNRTGVFPTTTNPDGSGNYIFNSDPQGLRFEEPERYFQHFVGLTPDQDNFLRSHMDFVGKNPFHLSGPTLMELYKIHDQNLHRIFAQSVYVMDSWNMLRDVQVKDVLKAEADPNNKFQIYVQQLYKLTRPHVTPQGGIVRKPETAEHYIARALQWLARHGRLDEVKVE
jgi:hypothetical protein